MKDRLQRAIAASRPLPRSTRTARRKALLVAMPCVLPIGVRAANPEEIAEARQKTSEA